MPNINDWPSLGQYVGVSHRHDRTVGRSKLVVAVYGAENAMGLIGSEYNGIVVLDDTKKQVLLDRHAPHPHGSGYHGPCAATVAEFRRLEGLPNLELVQFIRSHPRCRDKNYQPKQDRGKRSERKGRVREARLFAAEQFTATKYDTAEAKALFANQFVAFVESGFREELFTKAFYGRIMYLFHHIAHYNQLGFWEEFFTCLPDQLRFLRMARDHTAYGDPEHTWVDVERALTSWVRTRGLVESMHDRIEQLRGEAEIEQLKRLAEKHPDELAKLRR